MNFCFAARIGRSSALRRGRRSEPGGQRVSEPQLGSVSHPGHVSVGPDQHGGGSGDRAEYRKLPRTRRIWRRSAEPDLPME